MGKKAVIRLKELENQKLKLEGKLATLKSEQTQMSRDINEIVRKVNEIKSEIKNIKENTKEIIISDHAIVRYVERVIGIDVDKIKQEICPESTSENIKVLGNGAYTVNNNEFVIKVKENVVVTLVKD